MAKPLPFLLMKNWLTVFKSTNISKNVLQNLAGLPGILTDPVTAVGIGANGDDFAAQLPETAEVIRSGQETSAAVNAAGVHFQPFSLGCQNPQNFVNDFPVLLIRHRARSGMTGSLADIGQMGQYIKILVNLNTGQGFFQVPALCLKDGFSFPVPGKVHIQLVYKVDGAQYKIKRPPL